MEDKTHKEPAMRIEIAMDWKCSCCGSSVADDDVFCSNCGDEFHEE